jgi:hypothetical protein
MDINFSDAQLKLTQCGRCLGCNRLENPNFRGDRNCLRVIEDKTGQGEQMKISEVPQNGSEKTDR